MTSWYYYQVRNIITVSFVYICTGKASIIVIAQNKDRRYRWEMSTRSNKGLLHEWSLIGCVQMRFSFKNKQHNGLGEGRMRMRIKKFHGALSQKFWSRITLFWLASRSDICFGPIDCSLLPRNKLKHIHRQPLLFCRSFISFYFL